MYAKPNVAIFNIEIFIQFNLRSFNSIPIVILFNPHSFNSIFGSTGETYLRGHFRAMGYTVQRRRIRESLNRVDPRNTALRWGALVSRRVYFVPWPNSLWHS